MIRRKIWDTFAEEVGPLLTENGFASDGQGFYVRELDDGRDQIALSIGREAKCEVLISYLPKDLLALDELLAPLEELEQKHRGFPVGPYLTAVGAFPNPRVWSFRTKEQALKSSEKIRKALETGGFPWLRSMRDPLKYFESAARHPMSYGFIAERAGKLDVARATYERWLAFYRERFERWGGRLEQLEPYMGRSHVYCAMKLDAVDDGCREYMKLLDFYPDVKPLPPE